MRLISILGGMAILAGCAATDSAPEFAITEGVYDLSYETWDGCGVLKTGSGSYYEWDDGCNGSIEYSQQNVQRFGNRFYIEAASFVVDGVTDNGFVGEFSYRGDTNRVTATLQSAN